MTLNKLIFNEIGKNKFIIWIWWKIYKKWLYVSFYKKYSTVIKVKGWRTALVEDAGKHRSTITPIFWYFK
jgi:hypothetical protein